MKAGKCVPHLIYILSPQLELDHMGQDFSRNIRPIFYGLWFLGLLFSAIFTELLGDEAYYWRYAQQLAWGYFDHPPGIAVLIAIGSRLFEGEFGVRILPMLFSMGSIFIWEQIVRPQQPNVFYGLVASIGILQFLGFLATPDAPFLFWASLFVWGMKAFLEKPTWQGSVLLAGCIAVMILSKYHGIMVVGLITLANLRLLGNRYFWLTAILSTILLLPHFLWHMEADFPAVEYHLFFRSTEPYRPDHTGQYLLNQPFILGPFAGIFMLMGGVRVKAKDAFERSLKFLFWGGYIFFFLMTFNGRVEGHWTLMVLPAGVYFGYHDLVDHPKAWRLLYRLIPVTLVLVIIAKFIIAFDVLPHEGLTKAIRKQYHQKKVSALAIQQRAGDLPVAFVNSYARASLYSFYTGKPAFAFNSYLGRKNQFDIWRSEDVYRGQTVMFIPNVPIKGLDTLPTPRHVWNYEIIDNFQAFSAINIDILNHPIEATASDSIRVTILMEDTGDQPHIFEANPDRPPRLHYQYFSGRFATHAWKSIPLSTDMIGTPIDLTFATPDKPGPYGLSVSIQAISVFPTFNSRRYELEILP